MAAPAAAQTSQKKKAKRTVLVAIRMSFSCGAFEYRRGEMIPVDEFPEHYPGALRDRLHGGFAELVLGAED